MASEAAVLGTPAIYVNSLTMGYIEDEQRYGLLHHFTNGRAALDKVRELLATPALKARYAERRARLLADKINPTPWLVDLGNRLLENRRNTPDLRFQRAAGNRSLESRQGVNARGRWPPRRDPGGPAPSHGQVPGFGRIRSRLAPSGDVAAFHLDRPLRSGYTRADVTTRPWTLGGIGWVSPSAFDGRHGFCGGAARPHAIRLTSDPMSHVTRPSLPGASDDRCLT